jgi:hypothetical protein
MLGATSQIVAAWRCSSGRRIGLVWTGCGRARWCRTRTICPDRLQTERGAFRGNRTPVTSKPTAVDRAANDNTVNGLQPKGTDLSVHRSDDLEWVAQGLNDRLRKRLAFKKSIELIGDLLLH